MTGKKNMAIRVAAKEAGITEQDMRDIMVTQKDGLIEVRFITEWMIYDCYMDQESYEVLGFDYRPIPINMQLKQSRDTKNGMAYGA